MKAVLWAMAVLGGVLTVAWITRPANRTEPPPASTSQRDEYRTLFGRQGQPRHWRACVLKSR